jgi:hypothetical protein
VLKTISTKRKGKEIPFLLLLAVGHSIIELPTI